MQGLAGMLLRHRPNHLLDQCPLLLLARCLRHLHQILLDKEHTKEEVRGGELELELER